MSDFFGSNSDPYERQVRGKFVQFSADDDDLISRNCKFGGQSLLCDNCLKISTDVEPLAGLEID